ncbi:hypothetical protein [Paracoccus sp. 228]|uniref:hypothetical protein n=1 Tax=Paracoccus sp. 228 TaxID=1192054 RepID=UPI0005E29559|nr:hypothetical protein [Paracoccus sp. 228]KIX18629.1 hypothetical protein SY26_00025 [Paracoccus sp. 228]
MSNEALTAWDIEADLLPAHWQLTLEQRRDYIIERWLIEGGDNQPFLDWVLREGHQPSRRIIEIVAQMMAKSAGVELPANMEPPFGMVIDRTGHAHGPKDMETEVRNFCVAAISDAKIDSGIKPGVADREAFKFAQECGFDGFGYDTVEKRRKAFRKSRGKYLRQPSGTKGKD